MITLHHLEKSQSIRILWLLEELRIPYEIKLYDRDPNTRLAPPAYKAVSPLGTAPVITDGAVALADTNAIVDYSLDGQPGSALRPAPGAANRAAYLFWFHTAQGSLQPLLTNKFVLGALTTRAPMLVRPIAKSLVGALNTAFFDPRLNALMKEIEKALGESEWFAGDALTAADIVMGYCMELAAHRAGMDEARFPNGHRFLKQMREYPSYNRAMEKDGKGTILLQAQKSRDKVGASVARRPRAPPPGLKPEDLGRKNRHRLRGEQFALSKVVVCNYLLLSF